MYNIYIVRVQSLGLAQNTEHNVNGSATDKLVDILQQYRDEVSLNFGVSITFLIW